MVHPAEGRAPHAREQSLGTTEAYPLLGHWPILQPCHVMECLGIARKGAPSNHGPITCSCLYWEIFFTREIEVFLLGSHLHDGHSPVPSTADVDRDFSKAPLSQFQTKPVSGGGGPLRRSLPYSSPRALG